jgi:selenide,water dikinase
MRVLNRAASEVLIEHGVTAATDVTGFGLLGHGFEMAKASGTRFVFDSASLPLLPGALEMAGAGIETDGGKHNRRFVWDDLDVAEGVPAESIALAHDPQTSGGLLAAVDRDRLDVVESGLRNGGVDVWRIGRVETGSGVALV